MTYTDVYIGKLSDGADPLDWGGDYRQGNTPREGIGAPIFPPARRTSPFSRLIAKIENGEFEGKRVDWGAWAARVTKEEVFAFIDECYKGDGLSSWHLERLATLRQAVVACEQNHVALVAEEF